MLFRSILYFSRYISEFLAKIFQSIVKYKFLALKDISFEYYEDFITADKDELKSFWEIQNTLAKTILTWFDLILKTFGYIVTRITFFIIEITSAFNINYSYIAIVNLNNVEDIDTPCCYGFFKFLQLITLPIVIFNCIVWFIFPFILWYKLDYDFVQIIIGPYFANIFAFAITFCVTTNIITWLEAAPYYKPISTIFDICLFAYNSGK